MRKLLALPILILALPGCNPKIHRLMPLQEGATWTYQAKPGLQDEVVDLKITDRVAVGNQNGYTLQSPWGTSHLAWQKDVLIASRLGDTNYDPPLPILKNIPNDQSESWNGTVTTANQSKTATATIEIQQTEIKVGTITFPATQSIINLKIGDERQELLTWFVLGKGIIQQEQRKNDLLINRLTYISGP